MIKLIKKRNNEKHGSYYIKPDYLYRTFAKNRNQKENYIINAVYSRINNKNLKPVTQQCVRIGINRYRKIDLYFPQINIGIECDEKYHENEEQKIKDINRSIEIEDKLNSIVLAKKYKSYKIKATLNHDKLFNRINEVADKISNYIKKNYKNMKWETQEETIKRKINEGAICINDNITYRTHNEVCDLFGIKSRPRRGSDIIDSNTKIWYPKLAIYENGKWLSKDKKWDNRLNDAWDTIHENKKIGNRKSVGQDEKKRKFLVFARTKNLEGKTGYRFIGVFELVKEKGKKRTYKRVSKVFYLNKTKK